MTIAWSARGISLSLSRKPASPWSPSITGWYWHNHWSPKGITLPRSCYNFHFVSLHNITFLNISVGEGLSLCECGITTSELLRKGFYIWNLTYSIAVLQRVCFTFLASKQIMAITIYILIIVLCSYSLLTNLPHTPTLLIGHWYKYI